jgi:hypothetical protein
MKVMGCPRFFVQRGWYEEGENKGSRWESIVYVKVGSTVRTAQCCGDPHEDVTLVHSLDRWNASIRGL